MTRALQQQLLSAIADVYHAEGRAAATQSAETLMAPSTSRFQAQPPCRSDATIRALLANSPHPACPAILAAQHLLEWSGNNLAEDLENDAADISNVAVLVSPTGPIVAPDIRLGLFYQKPDSYYALHNHDADETYVIIAGQALWTAGDDCRQRGVGEYIYHPSLMPHAFRAGPHGLLALWRWSGDVNTHSYAFLEDPEAMAG
ncbi:MAG: dimethylsulfonioproprionate lyase family protein [Albidovulum sp.]